MTAEIMLGTTNKNQATFLRSELYEQVNPEDISKIGFKTDVDTNIGEYFVCMFKNSLDETDGLAIVKSEDVNPESSGKITVHYHFPKKLLGILKSAYIIMLKKYLCKICGGRDSRVSERRIELLDDVNKIKEVFVI